MDVQALKRRAFVRAENHRLGHFLDDAGQDLVAWGRSYRCECGYSCAAPGDIFDHAQTCAAVEG